MINLTQALSTQNNNSTLRYSQEDPPVIVWNLTKSCNLNCIFCYYNAKRNFSGNGDINFNLAKRIVQQLKQAKIKHILLSGGEPLIYPKILNLLERLASFSIYIGISTNGTLINKNLAYVLKRAGLDYIGISLDGLEKTHNELRNSFQAFNQVLTGLRYAKAAGLKTGIRLTLNTYNFMQLKDFFSFVEDLKVDRLCFYHLVYSGRASAAGYDLSRLERQQAIKTIIELSDDWLKRKIPTQVLSVDNFSDTAVILNYIRKNKPKDYPSALDLLRRQSGCPAGKKILSIDHLGFLHPCQFWTEYRLADLRKDNLLDILGNGKLFNNTWKLRLKGRCERCSYQALCGGCRVRAYSVYKDFWQEDPACCLNDNEIKDETDILEHN